MNSSSIRDKYSTCSFSISLLCDLLYSDYCYQQALLDKPGPILVSFLMSIVMLMWFAVWSFTVSIHNIRSLLLAGRSDQCFLFFSWHPVSVTHLGVLLL